MALARVNYDGGLCIGARMLDDANASRLRQDVVPKDSLVKKELDPIWGRPGQEHGMEQGSPVPAIACAATGLQLHVQHVQQGRDGQQAHVQKGALSTCTTAASMAAEATGSAHAVSFCPLQRLVHAYVRMIITGNYWYIR